MSKIGFRIEHQTLADKVYSHIKKLILSGQLVAGERIPEEKIAKEFGLSRTPIREALLRLEEYGLIRIEPRSYSEVVGLLPTEAEDVALLRASLECLAVSLLSSRGSDKDFEDLERLSNNCELSLSSGEVGRTFEIDSEFHIEIAKRSKNWHLYTLFEKIDAKVQLLRLVLRLPKNVLLEFILQHHQILAAARARNVNKAKHLMRHHILDQLRYY